jgi:hypothetical protein
MPDATDSADKVQENRLRRWARRLGLTLRKSRRMISLDNRGGYMVVNLNNWIVAGERFDLTAADVESLLEDHEKKLAVKV